MRKIIGILLCLWLPGIMLAQAPAGTKLKIFVEGNIPDFNYLRSHMEFVDFVNDPHASDVHVIVTRKSTGSGGRHYFIRFSPVTVESVDEFTLNCITSSQDTDALKRTRFAESVKSGILIFMNEKQISYRVEVSGNGALDNEATVDSEVKDPWNNWVFHIGVNGGLEAEEQKQDFEYDASIEANRITEKWRIQNEYDFGREETFINTDEDDEGNSIHAFNQEQELSSRFVRSLSTHWSAGIFMNAYRKTYKNIQFKGEATAAVEYNIYPWSQINRRTFTIAYFVGPRYYDYYETTILNKTSEWLWSEKLKIDLQKTEDWGELEVWLQAEHYFPDFEFYAIEAGSEFSVRIAKGLFFEFEIAIERINNQLYLQAKELSDEDILLNTRKLPTSFEFSTEIGIQYRFGSIYNNVVNQRL